MPQAFAYEYGVLQETDTSIYLFRYAGDHKGQDFVDNLYGVLNVLARSNWELVSHHVDSHGAREANTWIMRRLEE